MKSIRTFIISSSTFLAVWLTASYTTQPENNQPVPTVQQASAVTDLSPATATDREQETHRVR
ncbi:MAG: hypothetical protein H7A51_17525 [Akkermansiaceae bacterium]|nr:hypothetical protein [Akkermansiaceae bacterium]